MTQEQNESAPTGPRTVKEAIALVSSQFAWRNPDGTRGEFTAAEFSQGFVVFPLLPPVDPADGPPDAYGCTVVDREGRFTNLPFVGVEGTAEMYLRMQGL